MKRKTYVFDVPNNTTQLDMDCKNPKCVKGWLDHFEEGKPTKPLPEKIILRMMKQSGLTRDQLLKGFDKPSADYVCSIPCPKCKPLTSDYLKLFPNVGERTEAVLAAMREKRQQFITKGGKKNDF